jgi:hypothetical protein
MTIIEAIKSGKRFRRKSEATYRGFAKPYDCRNESALLRSDDEDIALTIADLIADDWEVEEKKVEITRTQLTQAVDTVLSKYPLSYGLREHLAEELGLD